MSAAHTPEAVELGRRVGWADAAFDVAQKHGLSAPEARSLGQAVKGILEEEFRVAFKARVARGGMRHVGNSGRV